MLQLKATSGDITQSSADAIIVNLFEGVTQPGGGTGAVDKALGGVIAQELQVSKLFTGKLADTLVLPTYGKIKPRYVILVGLGKSDKLTSFELRRASAAAIRACQKLKVKTVETILHGAGIGGFDVEAAARLLAEGALLGSYQFRLRKSEPKKAEDKPVAIETLTIVETDKAKLSAIEKGMALGQAIATHANLARDWVNDSANYVTPTFLKNQSEAIKGLDCNVLDMKAMQKLKMGLFELVAKGSDEPPYLIHLSYKPKSGKPKKKVTLVGKGLTFDSGGLSLKPSKSMELMKMDMAGSAAVIAVMKAIAEVGNLDIQVDGFVGTCENMPSGGSSKPGDIVTAMNGKTVEVNNTDAEGRLVLGDVLTYAQQQTDPDELIDLATLTGACITALGTVASGIMGDQNQEKSQAMINQIIASGKAAGEKFWQLPLYEEYRKALDSDVADLINANAQGEAGSQNGGMFLKEFVDEGRTWAHLDIAGPAMISKDFPETPKGATGVAVRTLLYYLYGLS